ncbi:MAG: isocitrate/isopropylmalate dehydrogenase family protein [Pseudomonadota bacterium]
MLTLLCLDGDGIGPEITAAARRALAAAAEATGTAITLERMAVGFEALEETGTTMPEAVIERAHAVDGVVIGPVSHNTYPPAEEGGVNPSGTLRKRLALHANIRPARSRHGVPTPTGSPVNMIVVRENLEGFYADRNMHEGPGEFMPVEGVALAIRRITAEGSRRIAENAFGLARAHGRRRVTAIHKGNVMRVSDGLFLDTCRAVAARYPGIAYEEMLVDAAAALMVRHPGRFDVVLATNMFGDILSDLASELAGGLGLAASLNVGERHAMAQAQHGSAPDIAGQNVANPTSLIASTAMLLDHLGRGEAAQAINTALDACLASSETRTPDLGGTLSTTAFTDMICRHIAAAGGGAP